MTWGYAENAIGVIVGCIGTLRPLFRKILHLGGSESDPSAPGTGNKFASSSNNFPTNSRARYQEFDATYELEDGLGSDPATDKYGSTMHATQIHAGQRSGSLSDSDSQKQILDSNSTGIVVQSNIQISRD